jgi:hypothetical protein
VTAGLLWALLSRIDLGHAKDLVDHLSSPLLAAGIAALLARALSARCDGTSSWRLLLKDHT